MDETEALRAEVAELRAEVERLRAWQDGHACQPVTYWWPSAPGTGFAAPAPTTTTLRPWTNVCGAAGAGNTVTVLPDRQVMVKYDTTGCAGAVPNLVMNVTGGNY